MYNFRPRKNPPLKMQHYSDDEEESDNQPGDESEDDQAGGMMQKQAAKRPADKSHRPTYDLYEDSFRRVVSGSVRTAGANSSVDTDSLSGPRIDSVGPGSTEHGWFNDMDALPSDHMDGDFRVGDNPLYDGDEASAYTNPTMGDASSFKVSTSTYSMLPGSNNNQILPIYTPGISQEEIDYLINNSAPRVHGVAVAPKKKSTKYLWGK
jgi:hypothetical protein